VTQLGVPQAQLQTQGSPLDIRAAGEDRVEASPRPDNQRWDGQSMMPYVSMASQVTTASATSQVALPELIGVVPRPPDMQGQTKGSGPHAGSLPQSKFSPPEDESGRMAPVTTALSTSQDKEGECVSKPNLLMSSKSSADLVNRGRRSVAVLKKSAEAVKAEVVGTQEAPKAVFADAAAMKEKLRQALHAPEYNVADYYHETGCWQKIARSFIFEHLTLAVISFNAIWIAVDTDQNTADTLINAEPVFQIAEHSFCLFFSFEWLCRFMSFKEKRSCLKDGWFIFDSCLVFLMVMETWVLTIVFLFFASGNSSGLGNVSIVRVLRLLRLTRMARMARLLRAMPELMILIKGMFVAARSVFFTLLLLVTFIYVFAIAFTQLVGEGEMKDKYFPNVGKSMSTLLLSGTLPDHADTVVDISEDNMLYAAIFLFYMLLGSLTVMNMLVGVLVEVVSVVSSVEKEQMVVNFVKVQLAQMMKTSGLDANHDNLISKSEFQTLLEKPEAARALQDVGVDVVGLVDFTDFIFKDGVELSFPNFMEMVLQLRGSNTATVKDIVDFRKFIMTEMKELQEKVCQKICGSLTPMLGGMITPIPSRPCSENISTQRKDQYRPRISRDFATASQESEAPAILATSEGYQT